MRKHKKACIGIALGLCGLTLLSIFVATVVKWQSKKEISVSWSNIHKADAQEIADFPFYSLDEEGKFWGYFEGTSSHNELYANATEYSIEDYVPYTITVSIMNAARFPIEGSHLIGIYSEECVLTYVLFDAIYSSEDIKPGKEVQKQLLIWFNKEMSKEQIDQYLQTLRISYELIGDLAFFPNTYYPKSFVVESHIAGEVVS